MSRPVGDTMAESTRDIVIATEGLEPSELARLVQLYFGDMVKYVVDVERRIAAVGGQLIGRGEPLT